MAICPHSCLEFHIYYTRLSCLYYRTRPVPKEDPIRFLPLPPLPFPLLLFVSRAPRERVAWSAGTHARSRDTNPLTFSYFIRHKISVTNGWRSQIPVPERSATGCGLRWCHSAREWFTVTRQADDIVKNKIFPRHQIRPFCVIKVKSSINHFIHPALFHEEDRDYSHSSGIPSGTLDPHLQPNDAEGKENTIDFFLCRFLIASVSEARNITQEMTVHSG